MDLTRHLRRSPLGSICLAAYHQLVLVTVMDAPDEASLAGSGHAGPELSPKEFDDQVSQARETAETAIRRAQSELDLTGVKIQILQGDPGAAICQLATQLSARAIVVGSRGRGGLKRAFSGIGVRSRRPQRRRAAWSSPRSRRRDKNLPSGIPNGAVRHSRSPGVRCRLPHYWSQCFRYCSSEITNAEGRLSGGENGRSGHERPLPPRRSFRRPNDRRRDTDKWLEIDGEGR